MLSVDFEASLPSLIFYYLLILVVCIAVEAYQYLYLEKVEKKPVADRLIRLLVILPFVLAVGLRSSNVGYDTPEYIASFQSISNYSLGQVVSLRNTGFNILQLVFSSIFGNSYTLFFIFISGATAYLLLSGLIRFSNRVHRISLSFGMFALMMLFAFNAMDQMRQMLAMSIWFYGISYIFEKRLLAYVAVVVLASIIHGSLLIVLPMYFFSWDLDRRRHVAFLGLFVLSLILASFSSSIFSFASFIFRNADYFSVYFSRESMLQTVEGTGSGLGFILNLAPIVFPLLFPAPSMNNKVYSFFLLSSLYAIPLRMLGYESFFLSRLYLIPALTSVLSYPVAVSELRIADKRSAALFQLVCFLFLGFIFGYFTLTSHGIVPYSSVLAVR